MIQKTVHRFIKRTHFWRDTGLDELSELYISNLLRMTALTIFVMFVPYFLYNNGYSPAQIFALFGFFFVTRAIFDILAAYIVAGAGPKHTMISSCILQIISACLLLTVPGHHWNIIILALPWGASEVCSLLRIT